ncbi:TniQ family protein [Streptomyces sp. NPDC096538]|uniref:TniQ family protein n=1 Tax=Streptomyces sp. NPDC096538 TaxID=3155427 RepID=UPI00332C900A
MRGVLRVAPLGGETTWSYLCRLAARYGMDGAVLLDGWRQANRRPRPRRGSTTAAVVEVLFDVVGQELLAELSGISQSTLARALPTWQQGPAAFASASGTPRTGPKNCGRAPEGPWPGRLEAGRVRFQDARTFGSVAIACGLCTARRTGHPVHAARYLPPWRRVCHRHQRWQSDADHDEQPGWLGVATCPEIGRAQQRWPALARHAARRGHDPCQAFALARTIVLRWWQQAPAWQAERWPARVHRLTHGAAGGPETVWSAAVREAAVLPETIALAQALTDPACIRLAHADRGHRRPGGWSAGGRFVHHLGHRLSRPWLGPLLNVDYTSPLHAWIDAAVPLSTAPARS